MLRWIGRLLALAVTLLVVVTAATGILLWASLPKHEGERRLPGLGDRVIGIAALADVMSGIVIMVLVLLVRPEGLFGSPAARKI